MARFFWSVLATGVVALLVHFQPWLCRSSVGQTLLSGGASQESYRAKDEPAVTLPGAPAPPKPPSVVEDSAPASSVVRTNAVQVPGTTDVGGSGIQLPAPPPAAPPVVGASQEPPPAPAPPSPAPPAPPPTPPVSKGDAETKQPLIPAGARSESTGKKPHHPSVVQSPPAPSDFQPPPAAPVPPLGNVNPVSPPPLPMTPVPMTTPQAPPALRQPEPGTPPPVERTPPGLLEDSANKPVKPFTSPWTFHLEIADGKNLVTAKVGKTVQFRIVCEKIEIQSPPGNIQASGGVKISSQSLEVTCDRLTINLHDEAVLLEGSAHMKCQHEGQELDLRSDRLSLKLSDMHGTAPGSSVRPSGRPPVVSVQP